MTVGVSWLRLGCGAGLSIILLAFGGCSSSLLTGPTSTAVAPSQATYQGQYQEQADGQYQEPSGEPLSLHEKRNGGARSFVSTSAAATVTSSRANSTDRLAEDVSSDDDAALRKKLVICSGCQTNAGSQKKRETVDQAASSIEDERWRQ